MRSRRGGDDKMDMQGYDLDGTLAAVDFRSDQPLPRMFAEAPVIHRPIHPFVVITGRPHATAEERNATLRWLHANQPMEHGIYYVAGHSAQDTARLKGALIRRLRLTDYTDNNREVLAALVSIVPNTSLWFMSSSGERRPFAQIDVASLAKRWAPTLGA